ncbi:MAG: hypothetical protein RR405_00455 [Clostridia bacterium]
MDEFDEADITTFKNEIISIKDMETALGIGYDKAASLIRSIREYSDCLNLSGKVHRSDYLKFLRRKQQPIKASQRGRK